MREMRRVMAPMYVTLSVEQLSVGATIQQQEEEDVLCVEEEDAAAAALPETARGMLATTVADDVITSDMSTIADLRLADPVHTVTRYPQ